VTIGQSAGYAATLIMQIRAQIGPSMIAAFRICPGQPL
jgi:hypothetical protein